MSFCPLIVTGQGRKPVPRTCPIRTNVETLVLRQDAPHGAVVMREQMILLILVGIAFWLLLLALVSHRGR